MLGNFNLKYPNHKWKYLNKKWFPENKIIILKMEEDQLVSVKILIDNLQHKLSGNFQSMLLRGKLGGVKFYSRKKLINLLNFIKTHQ